MSMKLIVKITLAEAHPAEWRSVWIQDDISFEKLHEII